MSVSLRSARHGIRLLMAFALSHGWKVSRTQGGHIRFTKAGMPPIFTSSTPSDYRAERQGAAASCRLLSLTIPTGGDQC
jgi:hypothetical protein